MKHATLRVVYPVVIAAFLALAWRNFQGAEQQEALPNTREMHTDVLYVNIPVDPEILQKVVGDELQPDVFDGKAWISVAFSYAVFDFYIPFFGLVHFDSFAGYQHKINILVWDKKRNVPGYLIANIYFERGLTGWIKSIGAVITQSLPATTVEYDVISTESSVKVVWTQGSESIQIEADLEAGRHESDFSHFVIDRPYKYLLERNGRTVYSPLFPTPEDLAHFQVNAYNQSFNKNVRQTVVSGNLLSGTELNTLVNFNSQQVRSIWSERIIFLNRENVVA